jgi:hypothetical protein
MELAYRSSALIEDLQPGECTVHRASVPGGKAWWLLWVRVYREDRAGQTATIAVAVNPNGPYAEDGPGGRTWGLRPAGPGRWRVDPSIDAKGERSAVPGFLQHPAPSIWHQTPTLVGVPTGEAWQSVAP